MGGTPPPYTADRLARLRGEGGSSTTHPADYDTRQPVRLLGDVTTTPPATTQPQPVVSLALELPDPVESRAAFDRRLAGISTRVRRDYAEVFRRATLRIEEIARPQHVRLSLWDCLRRTLANNYQVQIQGYGGAISTAQIVQAEAAFDAAFFSTLSKTENDPALPHGNRRHGVFLSSDSRLYEAGLRQRLITGAQVTLTQVLSGGVGPRIVGQELNPLYNTNFIAEFRQPLLRNFGIDFNRSQIDIAKNSREINGEGWRRQVIQSLNDVERAYWTLLGARRNLVISAELLAQAELTERQVLARIDYDAYITLLANSRAQVYTRQAQFIRDRNAVGDAEDQLRNLMSDPELNLARDVAIIPTEDPIVISTVRDGFREVEIALQRRPEINQARLAVDNARIQMGIAKNQALPTLDFVFRSTLNGRGSNPDQAYDQMTTSNFIDTLVSLEFAWNFAERGERAGIRIAALQHSQSVAAYKASVDGAITDVKVALRGLNNNLQQIGPNSQAIYAASENLRSIQEREERKSPEQLNTVFSAQSQVASTRQSLLQSIVTYNQSIVEVERAKGTLLEYDNVVFTERP